MADCPRCSRDNAEGARFCQSCGARLEDGSDPEITRRTATVLFCDLVGSTALAESIDPEILRLVITRYFEEMKRIVTGNGGLVEKFIGDAVMGVFGIPELHEDDALRGVSAAAQMRESIETMNTDLRAQWGIELQIRIGVNSGEVVTGDPSSGHGFVSGDPVNVAARLQQFAAPGEIILGAHTEELVRDATVSEYLGPTAIAGKADPLPTFKLVDILRGGLGHSRRLDSRLVGRGDELRILQDVFTGTIADLRPRLATIVGVPGAGKSRLATQFVSLVAGEAHVLTVGFQSFGEAESLAPFGDAIRDVCGIPDEASVDEASSKLRAILGDGNDQPAVVDRLLYLLDLNPVPADLQDVFWAVRKLCEALSHSRPVVVFLDDLQWAAPAIFDLVDYLLTFAKAPLAVVTVSRRDLFEEHPNWGRGATALELEPLSDDEIFQLTTNLLDGQTMPLALQHRVAEMAEGNPLYVEELIRSLIDTDVLTRDVDGWEFHGEIAEIRTPPTIGAIVAARLESLGLSERVIVERAAVIGKTFWWKALSKLLPDDESSNLARDLQSLIRKEIIEPDLSFNDEDDSFRFKHMAVREIAYEGISKLKRARLHEQFATWLEGAGLPDRCDELVAFHLEQVVLLKRALGVQDEAVIDLGRKAASLLESAAERALETADARTAVSTLRRATGLQPVGDPALLGQTIKLGNALLEEGELRAARRELEQASRRAMVDERPEAWAQSELLCMMLDNYLGTGGEIAIDLGRLDSLQHVFEERGDSQWLGRAELLRANLFWDRYRLGEAEAALGRALSLARNAGSALDASRALGSLTAVLLRGPHAVDDAIERCETILKLSSDQLVVHAKSLLRLAGLHAMRDEFDSARKMVRESRGILEDLGRTFELAAGTHEAGLVEIFAGDHAAAEKEFAAGIEVLESIEERATLATSAAYLARSLYSQGRYEEAFHWTEESEAAWGSDGYGIVEWGPTRAKILARWEHVEDAETVAMAALAPIRGSDDILARGHALVGLADVLAMIGKRDQAPACLSEANSLYAAKGIRPLARRVLSKLVATDAA